MRTRARTARRGTTRDRRPVRWAAAISLLLATVVIVGSSPAFASVLHALGVVTGRPVTTTYSAAAAASAASIAPSTAPATQSPAHPTGTLTVVGLGDSVTSGYACDCTSYLTTAAQSVAATQGRAVTVTNEAYAGATSESVLAQLTDAGVRSQIQKAELVVIEIGANDFDESVADEAQCNPAQTSGCFTASAMSMQADLTSIVSQVKSLQTIPGAQVVVLGYWNVFRDGAVARAEGPTYVTVSRQLTQWVNTLDAQVASNASVIDADAATPFLGASATGDDTAYLADDGDHPNAAGHALLAQAVVDALGDRVATL